VPLALPKRETPKTGFLDPPQKCDTRGHGKGIHAFLERGIGVLSGFSRLSDVRNGVWIIPSWMKKKENQQVS
jgi:hypothetical protein